MHSEADLEYNRKVRLLRELQQRDREERQRRLRLKWERELLEIERLSQPLISAELLSQAEREEISRSTRRGIGAQRWLEDVFA